MKTPVILIILSFLLSCCTPKEKNLLLEISDNNWYLWPDTAAKWQEDSLYLPNEFDIKKLPVNIPSGGWKILNNRNGKAINLPSTVEEHFWGKLGIRNYKENEYYYSINDSSMKNGNYEGVSWWWKEVYIPRSFKSKNIDLFIRGSRLRAEIYINKILVGYNIINEISYTCDVTEAIKPGRKNLIAIRITNPGGVLDWIDYKSMKWGKHEFHKSHGFGGLDRGITLRAHDSVFISDLYTLNTSTISTITANSLVKNGSKKEKIVLIKYQLIEKASGKICLSTEKEMLIKAGTEQLIDKQIQYHDAKHWSAENPTLYTLNATLSVKESNDNDFQTVDVGFRWFNAEGIGKNAILKYNHERIRIISAISWGYWGINGLFPTKQLAEKEVLAAKNLGLNCIQFHRNVGKTDVLDAQDRLGLYRYMEAGGGITAFHTDIKANGTSPDFIVDASGKGGNPKTFAEKYMYAKLIGMIRDHRHHPSLLMYVIQNEESVSLNNPRIFYLIRKMHEEDPSRIIALKSGINTLNQVWVKPYSDSLQYDNGKGFSGWWDQHTVGGQGVWKDELYKNTEDFTHFSKKDDEIVMWGEMLGSATPDNHALMVAQLSQYVNTYDFNDHKKILKGYSDFMSRWNFMSSFVSVKNFFHESGRKSYDFWGRVIETARLSESNDYLVISGWESTTIENHSGLVDNLRNFKSDPALIKERLAPLKPVFKARKLVIEKGESLVFDLFLLNETHKEHDTSLILSVTDPDGNTSELGKYQVNPLKKDSFVYLIAKEQKTPNLNLEGEYTFYFGFKNSKKQTIEKILVVNSIVDTTQMPLRIGVATANLTIIKNLQQLTGRKIEKYDSIKDYDLIICSNSFGLGHIKKSSKFIEIGNTDDDSLFQSTCISGYPLPYMVPYFSFKDLPGKQSKVTLRFSPLFPTGEFDVSINGKKVLTKLSISKETNKLSNCLDKSFIINTSDGNLLIDLTSYGAQLSAIKIESAGKIFAYNCSRKDYTDKKGLVWKQYQGISFIDSSIMKKVKNGTNFLILPDGSNAAALDAKILGTYGVIKYKGEVGEVRASWMGSWYFVKEHNILSGLPTNCIMGSYYQANVNGGNGILLDGKNIDVFIGYSRDHDVNVGATSFTCKYGKGKIVFHALTGLIPALDNNSERINSIIGKRIVTNSIKYLK